MDSKRFARLAGYMVAVLVASIAVLALPFIGGGGWFPDSIGPQADRVDRITYWMTVVVVIITALVTGLVLYSITHFKARKGDLSDGVPTHGHHKLEVFWTVVPAIIVTAITIGSYAIMTDNEAKAADTDMTITVHAFQFGWNFDYPTYRAADLKDAKHVTRAANLVLPQGEEVDFRISSDQKDVLHSFWVPEARIKQDAVPGVVRDEQWKPTRLTRRGEHTKVVCAELCGGGHSGMLADYCVVKRDVFVEWTQDGGEKTCADLQKEMPK
jgi:cytochrome c oxidase subunit 2